MADNIVKRGFEEFDRGTIENIAEYLSPEELYSDVIDRVRKYHPSDDISLIEKGYEVARKAHEGQKRKSGEPYIIHPLYVALILADLELDKETITAGLLHDVVEDTIMTREEIEEQFIRTRPRSSRRSRPETCERCSSLWPRISASF